MNFRILLTCFIVHILYPCLAQNKEIHVYKNTYSINDAVCTNIKCQITNHGAEPMLVFLTTFDLANIDNNDKLNKICNKRYGEFILAFLPNEERSVRTEPMSIKDPFITIIKEKASFSFILNHAEKKTDIVDILTRHLFILNTSDVEAQYPGLVEALQKYNMIYTPSFISFETDELFQELCL